MPVNPIFASTATDAPIGFAEMQQPDTIRVPLTAGETLSPQQFLQRAVMLALGTGDAQKAADFLKQSGLERHALPESETKDGAAFLPFKTDAKF